MLTHTHILLTSNTFALLRILCLSNIHYYHVQHQEPSYLQINHSSDESTLPLLLRFAKRNTRTCTEEAPPIISLCTLPSLTIPSATTTSNLLIRSSYHNFKDRDVRIDKEATELTGKYTEKPFSAPPTPIPSITPSSGLDLISPLTIHD